MVWADRAKRHLGLALAGGALLALASCTMPRAEPPHTFPSTAPSLEASVYLTSSGPAQPGATYDYPAPRGGETRVTLTAAQGRPLSVELRCDGPARVVPAGEEGPGLFLRPGATRRITLPGRADGTSPVLVLGDKAATCTLLWGERHRLHLRPAVEAEAAAPVQTGCPVPTVALADPLAQAFFAGRALEMTCAAPTGPVEMVPGELDALKWRLDRLTGSDISRAALALGDPDMSLDFSAAPRFDEIIVSYLLIRADLSGWLTTRALAAHAAAGTRVRILASATLVAGFDRRPFEALAAAYPNVTVQYYSDPPQHLGDMVIAPQRAQHVKLFLGLSREPGRSFALVGGRNLMDGFFFKTDSLGPRPPFLRRYGADDEGLEGLVFESHYDDFEVALTDWARVAEISRQFARFYERDAPTQAMRPPPAPASARPQPRAEGAVRHFISQPVADGWALEKLYVDLFDAARREIFIVSPFNYPTPKIEAALLRAAARGVDVRFVTRLGADEPPAAFTRALNAEFQDQHAGHFRFRLYDEDDLLLHAKIVVIDGRLGLVASSNLNRRSFIHDTENGLVFLDSNVAARLRAEAERYWAIGAEADDPQPYTLPLGLLHAVPWLEQFL